MKHATMLLVVLVALVTGSLGARADSGNPFGFETNKHPLEYEYCKKEPGLARGHGYTCNSAPRPHPDLEEYGLEFVEDVGLCRIAAKHPNAFSESMFEMFKSQIAKKYGLPTTRKIRRPDRDEADYYWHPEAGFNGLGDIKAIELDGVIGRYILISFWLVTNDACQKKINEKANRAF